jgi:hypothetical protein
VLKKTLHLLDITSLFHLMKHEPFCFLSLPCGCLPGTFPGSHGRGGAVDVKASSDPSSVLPFSSSLSSGSIIFRTVIYEGLKSIAFALLILIGGVFLEQYQPV